MTSQQSLGPGPGGDRDNYIVVRSTGLKELAANYEPKVVQDIFTDRVDKVYTKLGKILVDEVKKRTPVSSGRLRRSTKFRIVRGTRIERVGEREFSVSRPADAQLQIIQDELARGDMAVSRRYYYWFTVTHGIAPKGKLTSAFPPPEHLLPWVRREFSVDQAGAKVASAKLSRHIGTEGTEPNKYIADAYHARIADIQQAAETLGVDITFDLSKLPSIEYPGY